MDKIKQATATQTLGGHNMGIPYDPTKPAANDKPSNDQAPMQTNFASIKQLIDVDHVDFADGQYGKHKQVAFPFNNVPTFPLAAPTLFTDVVAGLSQLKFFSGTAAQSANQYVVGTNGSTFLLGGIIIKWFTTSVTNSNNVNLSASIGSAFPHNGYAGVATSSDPDRPAAISALSATNVTVSIASPGNPPVNVFVILIGD